VPQPNDRAVWPRRINRRPNPMFWTPRWDASFLPSRRCV